MPFSLHPSGFCSFYSETNKRNLLAGAPCSECGRVAGHSIDCSSFKYDETKGRTSRPKLFDSTAVLWARDPDKSFLTFTLPSLRGGTYQRDVDCPLTGDLQVAAKFSKVLEAWSVKVKRAGKKLSYVWCAEAQMIRKENYGGVGDVHYHLVCNQQIKNDRGHVTDKKTLTWLQDLWCDHVGVHAKNCLHVDPLPDRIESIPAYLTKQMSRYMSKGAHRMILGRQFSATRDLTRFKPITMSRPPECDLISTRDIVTPDGYETSVHYFDTRQVLELYGAEMLREFSFSGSRTSPQFSDDAIVARAHDRAVKRALMIDRPSVDDALYQGWLHSHA